MGLIIGIVAAVVVIGGACAIGALFKSSLKAGSKDAASVSKLSAMSADDSSKLSDARRSIVSSRQLALRVKDDEIKQQVGNVLDQAEKIIDAMKKQPDEIRRARQFFGYYLPTINTVLGKYVELESSGMDISSQRNTVLSYVDDMRSAFDALYKGMFEDEKLDLEVEAEAMQVALKRDGLL